MVYITHGIDFCFVVCLDFIFFLKLTDINSIFDFRITNSQQIFSLPFPMSVLCKNPIKVILKVTSPWLYKQQTTAQGQSEGLKLLNTTWQNQ